MIFRVFNGRANKGKNPGADWHPKKGVTSQDMGVSKNIGVPQNGWF